MWDQNHPYQSHYNPPMTPETVAQAHFGFLAGTPVDAYVCALGPDAGYVTAFKSQRTQMEFLVERYERGAVLGDVRYWRHAENLKQSLAQGIDPVAHRLEEHTRKKPTSASAPFHSGPNTCTCAHASSTSSFLSAVSSSCRFCCFRLFELTSCHRSSFL